MMALTQGKDNKNLFIFGGVGLAVMLALIFVFSGNSAVGCIENVLAKDAEIGKKYSGQPIKNVSEMKKIGFSSCPQDFRVVWQKHVQAWEDSAAIAPEVARMEKQYEQNEKQQGNELAALLLTMGQNIFTVGDLIEKSDKSSELIASTYKELELIAAKYGAELPNK